MIKTDREIGNLLRNQPLASFVGMNGSGLPRGEDDGFWNKEPLERFDGGKRRAKPQYDQLIRVPESVPQRPMYYQMGWTSNPTLYIRDVALRHWEVLDRYLERYFGWRVRLKDTFRPKALQLRGFEWSVGQVLEKDNHGVTTSDFKSLCERVLGGEMRGKKWQEVHDFVWRVFEDARHLFCYMTPKPWDQKQFPRKTDDLIVIGAASLGLADLEVDDLYPAPHSTGMAADIELIETETGRLVNMGVPVDSQGICTWFGFYDPVVTTMIEPELRKRGLLPLAARKKYYHDEVRRRREFQDHLVACGVDVLEFLRGKRYFTEVWNEICGNRRGFAAVCDMLGVHIYGGEWWHVEFDNRYGGVLSDLLVSGGPPVAIYRGQEFSIAGNATPLYNALTGAR